MQATNPFELDPDDFPLQSENDAMVRAAMETTRDAIARWTGGIYRPRMLQIGSLQGRHLSSPQARWYARACEGFEKWREGGGFAQDERAVQADSPAINIDSEDVYN